MWPNGAVADPVRRPTTEADARIHDPGGERACTRTRRGRRRLRAVTRGRAIWLYVLALAALAAVTFAGFVADQAPLFEPHLPWWALAPLFLVAEACVVHLQFRRSAHSFSLADIPFVLALVFAAGSAFVVAALLGAGAVWAFRRLPPVKLSFNLAQLALAACVAVVILRAVAPSGDDLGVLEP